MQRRFAGSIAGIGPTVWRGGVFRILSARPVYAFRLARLLQRRGPETSACFRSPELWIAFASAQCWERRRDNRRSLIDAHLEKIPIRRDGRRRAHKLVMPAQRFTPLAYARVRKLRTDVMGEEIPDFANKLQSAFTMPPISPKQ